MEPRRRTRRASLAGRVALVAKAADAPGARDAAEAADLDRPDDDQWPFYRYPRPLPGLVSRDEARERRIAGHVQKHRDRGAQPPRRDRGLSRDEIVRAAIAVADAE